MLRLRIHQRIVTVPSGYTQSKSQAPWIGLAIPICTVLGYLTFSKTPNPGVALTSFSLTVSLALFLAWLLVLTIRPEPETVRVARSGPLRFLPRPGTWSGLILVGLALSITGAITLLTLYLPSIYPVSGLIGGRFSRFSLGLVGLALGAYTFIGSIHRRTRFQGVEVTSDGIRWWTRGNTVHRTWEQIDAVSLSSEKGLQRLDLRDTSGDTFVVGPGQSGSDPCMLAEVILFFRDNPVHRPRLQYGATALSALGTVSRFPVRSNTR